MSRKYRRRGDGTRFEKGRNSPSFDADENMHPYRPSFFGSLGYDPRNYRNGAPDAAEQARLDSLCQEQLKPPGNNHIWKDLGWKQKHHLPA